MKNITHFILFAACSFNIIACTSLEKNKHPSRFSNSLNWGKNPLTQRPWTKTGLQKNLLVEKELKKLLNAAQKDLKDEYNIVAIDRIEKEGTLNSDPRHSASDKALDGTESILKWAICSSAGEPPVDLILDKLNTRDLENTKKWIRAFATKGDQFFENIHDGFTVNNWMTWRLAIRSLAGVILQDDKVISTTKKLIRTHANRNFTPPPNWAPSQNCPNNQNELQYGGHDFRRRDALHYHVYNLEAWTWIAVFTPEILDQQTIESINNAFDFLKPYYLGDKKHVEFMCSEIQFDKKRKDAGQREYENKNWVLCCPGSIVTGGGII